MSNSLSPALTSNIRGLTTDMPHVFCMWV